jgi:hypothetical protein
MRRCASANGSAVAWVFKMQQLLFIGGPSGSGKSTLASSLAETLGFLFLEVDLWCRDGVDFHKLRTEWNEFWEDLNAGPLAVVLLQRAKAAGMSGVVASLPSNALLTVPRIKSASAVGIGTIITYGPESACIGAFLLREKQIGRHLDEKHWRDFNAQSHGIYAGPDYSSVRVEMFDHNNSWRPKRDIVAEVQKRLHAV